MKRFQVGDRVCGSATSIAKEVNRAAEGGFQLYTVMRQHMITPIPLHVKDEQACVLGLGVVTAAYGLFHTKYLGLDMPTVPAPADHAHAHGKGDESGNSRTVIVTGGASSVGANAVQLAVAAGYQVISTSSPKNFEFVKSLGAAHVFDYRSKTIVDDMLRAIKGRQLAGAYAIGDGAVEVCSAVMLKHDVNLTRKYIALAGAQLPAGSLLTFWGKANFFLGMIFGMIKSKVSKWSTGIDVKFIMLEDLVNPDSVVAKVYTEFLPEALEKGQFVPAPPPEIVGHGLDKIQDALELQRQGVSGKKLVVTL